MDTRTAAARFRSLHQGPQPLLLPNAWDAGSARLIEASGAQAIATSSAGLAWARGYADGGALPAGLLLTTVSEIARVIRLPLTVDMEAGYADDLATIADNAQALASAGAVGINLEDGANPPEVLCERIGATKRGAARAGVDLFVNARCDVFLRGLTTPDRSVEESISRARRYREAGADGFFLPGVVAPAEIRQVASAVQLPLNVLVRAGLPRISELAALGVRRISAGSGIASAVHGLTRRAVRQFLDAGTYEAILDGAVPYAEMNALFAERP
ncbi:MAG TPA: isocitrate lyase/phosphoenolpyruvate mutase family protein [Myxococcaceae bacterium]|nr:isocitrate lyase/phosphoenolpyruvate mutase family protein [Myxococcaceae bacterium]